MKAVSDKVIQQTKDSIERPPGGGDPVTELDTAAVGADTANKVAATAPKKIFVCSPYRPTAENLRCQKKPVGSKHRPGKDSLQDSFHAGLPAAGSASVFHSVLEGRGEEGAGDRHEAGIALAGGSR